MAGTGSSPAAASGDQDPVVVFLSCHKYQWVSERTFPVGKEALD